ncbi:hypothetical protein [Helicobacter sp. 23-1045]
MCDLQIFLSLRGALSVNQMQKNPVIARQIVDSPKQSTNETFETNANRLL